MPLINIKNDKIGIGKIPNTTSSLEIEESWKVSGFFPIGSLYFNINNINPSIYFGGTWIRWGQGRVLIGVDENDSDFYEAELEGGASTHTLTSEEMPQHDHLMRRYENSVASGSTDLPLSYTTSGRTAYKSNTIGGGLAHNNLMPFATCYIWKRTA